MKVNTHRLTSTTPAPAIAPLGLISAMAFLIILPTELIIRLLTLLNFNALVLYYPSGLSSHKSRLLASFDNNSVLAPGLEDPTTDFLPSRFTHILQNHSISQSMPQWKRQESPVVVTIHLTVDLAQPPASHSFDRMVTINMAKLKLHNGILQTVSPQPSITAKPAFTITKITSFARKGPPACCRHQPSHPRTWVDLNLPCRMASSHPLEIILSFAISRSKKLKGRRAFPRSE